MVGERPIVLVTGVGRRVSIGTAIVLELAANGWDIAFTNFEPEPDFVDELTAELGELGANTFVIEADLADASAPEALLHAVVERFGPVRAVVSSHAQSVDSSILDTPIESFDHHFAVNTRANWLLIKAFAECYSAPHGAGRIVALTSDHTAQSPVWRKQGCPRPNRHRGSARTQTPWYHR